MMEIHGLSDAEVEFGIKCGYVPFGTSNSEGSLDSLADRVKLASGIEYEHIASLA